MILRLTEKLKVGLRKLKSDGLTVDILSIGSRTETLKTPTFSIAREHAGHGRLAA